VVTGLSHQHLEVRHTDFVEVAHLRDRRFQVGAGAIASLGLQFFGCRSDQALDAADVAVDVGVEEIHHQPMQLGVDKSGLGEQLLWGGFVIGLRGWREVRVDLDAPTSRWRLRVWIARRSSSRKIST
jgi:hypothetical protein